MAAVLLLVGRGLEESVIIQQLLDVENVSLKPQYNMAPEVSIGDCLRTCTVTGRRHVPCKAHLPA
jgi:hypothetical protein